MLRNTTFALSAVLLAASLAPAATISVASVPTVGVANSTTHTLQATADATERIIGFDFAGGGGTFGFNGPMGQVNPFGVLVTVFADNNAAFAGVPADVSADAQFKVLSSKGLAVNASESAQSLKAAFTYLAANIPTDASNVWQFVQIPIINGNAVNYAGTLTIRNGQGQDRLETFTGTLGAVIPEPTTFALLGLAVVGCLGLRRRS
jgi:hypothetical protein